MKRIALMVLVLILAISATAWAGENESGLTKQQQDRIAAVLQSEFGQYGIVSIEFIPGQPITVECGVLGPAGKGIILEIRMNTRLVRVIDMNPDDPEIMFGIIMAIQNVINPPASVKLGRNLLK